MQNKKIKKDFSDWHKSKTQIDHLEISPFYHEREVWWCALGLNIGFEQDGKGIDFARPVLIIKGFSRQVFLCVPLTTKPKKGKYYHPISLKDGIERKVILSQIRLVSVKRFRRFLRKISPNQFSLIKNKLIDFLRDP